MGSSKGRLTLELGSVDAGQIKLGRASAEAQSENKYLKELSDAYRVQ